MTQFPHSPDLLWRKASGSSGGGNECVEVADARHVVAVRDSKDPDGPRLAVSRTAWQVLTYRIRSGQFDL